MHFTNNKKWFCEICGASAEDNDMKNTDFHRHLLEHDLSIDEYRHLTEDVKIGAAQLKVKLLSWTNNVDESIVSFVSQTWGPTFDLSNYSQKEVKGIVDQALHGKTLPLALESIQFTFQIDNLSRAISHQLVRVRVGSAFSQKGMSDTYYGDTNYIIPAAIEAVGKTQQYISLMEEAKQLYRELFEAGVTFQDARYVLPHASTTSLVWSVNLLALKNFCAQRLSCTQSWEMNSLCKLIREEVRKVWPEAADVLKPKCELTRKCQSFGNLFEGCGKYQMDNPNRKFVFIKEQMAKNIKFNEAYRGFVQKHNTTVKKYTNYFRGNVEENGEI